MHRAGRRLWLLAVVGSLAAPPARAGEAPATLSLRAAEIDFSAIAPLTRELMRHELGVWLAPVSLELGWRRARPSDETDKDELRVILMRSTGVGGDAGALGSTSRGGPVPTIWVYVPTVARALGFEPEAVASSLESQRLLGVALGRVLAHEVVHLLAPHVEHADAGIMRAELHAFYLTRGRPELDAACAAALLSGARAWLAGGGPPQSAPWRALAQGR